ncbi:hypothetical protein SePPVgORF029 [Seal parapoxvirus]|uniref:Entry-fusion complex protein OPG086 n=1 Tax=Seal parapoxvirus TaxID=187984 RepID=A0A1Z3GCV9_9POXV|nr:hypothetical protein CGV03_gp029 [Seal parapoxvirus]ASC55600.1 hypothetical protein SePPVgORF029 [Seal parapoxvirus]
MTWALLEGVLFAAFLMLMYFLSYFPTTKMQFSVRELTDEKLRRQAVDEQLDGISESVIFAESDRPQSSAVLVTMDSRNSIVTVAYGREKALFNLKRRRDVQTLLPILLLSK